MTTAFEGSDDPLDLHRLACLPTECVVISAALGSDGAMQRVGGFPYKSALLKDDRFHALAVAKAQEEFTDHSTLSGGKQLLRAVNLRGLLEDLDQRLGDRLYGPAEPLPAVLQQQNRQPEDPEPDHRSFDYRSSAYHAQQRLDELLRLAVLEPPNARTVDAPTLPLDIVCKRHHKGYVYVVGTAGSGKTSWALNLVRASKARRFSNDAQAGAIVLDGWFFARRFDASGDSDAEVKRDEYNALQTVVSLARRHRGVVPASLTLDLLNEKQREGYRDRFYTGDANIGEILRARFAAALAELAKKASSQRPLVLLIDGVDEAKAARHAREAFLQILPKTADLPEHCYLILTSRPGHHVAWATDHNHDYRPILQYEFPQQDVQHEVHCYLDGVAANQEQLSQGETAALLRDPRLRANVCTASGRAFGYVPLLMGQWVRSPSDHRLDQLIAWRDQPGALPSGIYGLRAKELLDAEAELPRLGRGILTDGLGNPEPSLTRLLALLTHMRVALEQDEFLDLLVGKTSVGEQPSPRRIHHQLLLRVGSPFLEAAGTGSARPMLRFGHQSLAEIVQAAWRLRSHNNDVPAMTAEIKAEALRSTDDDARPLLTDEQRAQADVVLHMTLAQACQRWWHDEQVKPSIGPMVAVRDAQAYALVWGPWHALKAAAAMTDSDAAKQLGARARALLLNAGFLQSAIRAAGQMAKRRHEDADTEFLRQTYIAADKVSGDDSDQPLRHRIETSLLHWYQHIALGRLQLGAMFWNLLGAWPPASAHAPNWRGSLDSEALVMVKPGLPIDLTHRLAPFREAVISRCGLWLVTSGKSGTAIWSLQEGVRRARRIAFLPCCLSKLCCAAVGSQLYVAANWAYLSTEAIVTLVLVDIKSGFARYAGYAGLDQPITAVAMDARGNSITVATGSDDGMVGLLSLSRDEARVHCQAQREEDMQPLHGQLIRYLGHEEHVTSIATHMSEERVVVATASWDGTVGVLSLKHDATHAHRQSQGLDGKQPIAGHVAVYGGNGSPTRSVALSCSKEGLIVASGNDGGAVGLLDLSYCQVEADCKTQATNHAQPFAGHVVRLSGHEDWVLSVSMHLSEERIVVASGSMDETVGLVCVTRSQLRLLRQEHPRNDTRAVPGLMARYAGHRHRVMTVSLMCQDERAVVGSGDQGGGVGVLDLTFDQVVAHRQTHNLGQRVLRGALTIHTGHYAGVESVSLWCNPDRIVVASGSNDQSVGLLSLPRRENRMHANEIGESASQASCRQLARYSGHKAPVRSLAIHADRSQLVLASSAADEAIGLTSLTHAQVLAHCSRLDEHASEPLRGHLARYPGHHVLTVAVSLQPGTERIVVACSTWGSSLLILSLAPEQVNERARAQTSKRGAKPLSGHLSQYAGHVDLAQPMSLQVSDKHVVVADGSLDGTIGVLSLTHEQLRMHVRQQSKRGSVALRGHIARYSAHDEMVMSVALQADDQRILIASGSEDGTLGSLATTHDQVRADSHQQREDDAVPATGRVRRHEIGEWLSSVALQFDSTDTFVVGSPLPWFGTDVFLAFDRREPSESTAWKVDDSLLPSPWQTCSQPSHLIGTLEWRGSGAESTTRGRVYHWFATSHEAIVTAKWFAADPDPRLMYELVCPFYIEGFRARHVTALDRRYLAVAGTCGNDIALLLVERVHGEFT